MGLSLLMAGVWNPVEAENVSNHFERVTAFPDDGGDLSGYSAMIDIDTKEVLKSLGLGRHEAETLEGYTYVNSVKLNSPGGRNLFHQYKKKESSPMYALPGSGVSSITNNVVVQPGIAAVEPENKSKKNYVIPDPGFTSRDPLNRNSRKSEETPKTKKVGWVLENGKWFYFDQSGRKQVGWLQVGGVWYYLANDGQMQLGWFYIGNAWYYLNGSGAMNKGGWSKVGKSWYYFTNTGALLVNTTTPDGYRVNANGEWV